MKRADTAAFLLDRKLRCISYQAKSAPRGSHCGGTEFVASDPPQAENPALQDSIFIYRKLCRGLLFLGKLRGCVRGEQYTGMQLLYVAAHERAEVCMRGLVCACGVVLVH